MADNNLFNSIKHENYESKESFWGDRYKLLNSLDEKSEQDIFKYQLEKLRSSLDAKEGKENIYNVYKNSLKDIKLLEKFYKEEVPNDILQKIMEILNAPYQSSRFKVTGKYGGRYTDYDGKVAEALRVLTEEIKSNEDKNGFAFASIDRIMELQRLLRLGEKKGGIITKEYTKRKSNEAEQLTADVLNNSKIFKNYHAFVTGKLEVKGQHQLLQDVMMIDKQLLNKKFDKGLLTYEIKGQQGGSVSNIAELLKVMENASEKHHIILSDNLYKELVKASSLSIQTKSGFQQKIINRNTQRQVALESLLNNNKSKPAEALRLLNEIAIIGKRKGKEYFKDNFNSSIIQSWANYTLGKDIANLLHFGKEKVHLLFTDHGFETPYAWMKRTRMLLKFDMNINRIDSSFIYTKRYYNLRRKK